MHSIQWVNNDVTDIYTLTVSEENVTETNLSITEGNQKFIHKVKEYQHLNAI